MAAAPGFADSLNKHRRLLQSALADALHQLATLAVRHSGPTPAVPASASSAAMITAIRGTFAGINPAAMTALIHVLNQAATDLLSVGSRLATGLTTHGLSGHPGQVHSTR
ncbi:hypothetical protein ITP53_19295 [Nonomuraea sp. K274]|uniref:Uncharacterized protein n=1 Tax=Nonomuraea cypriaca TaxID=1187855 RepID=A0A931A7M7_9ACTN|nr:hypothetical protein [Nonomuraea cypriaca]MBF8187841.1 hypothetical protein [Nonomuraea cypriaca]